MRRSCLKYKKCRSRKTNISVAYINYIADIQVNFKHDPKSFWSFIRNKKCCSRIPNEGFLDDKHFNDPKDIVNDVVKFSNKSLFDSVN